MKYIVALVALLSVASAAAIPANKNVARQAPSADQPSMALADGTIVAYNVAAAKAAKGQA